MIMKPHYRGTRPEDIPQLAAEMRPEDIREVAASTGQSPIGALWEGFSTSLPCFTAFGKHDEILAIWGVSSGGFIWLLGSVHLSKYKKFFFKTSRELLDVLVEVNGGYLHNYCDSRNELHIKYLKALGAEFTENALEGIDGTYFHHFKFTGGN